MDGTHRLELLALYPNTTFFFLHCRFLIVASLCLSQPGLARLSLTKPGADRLSLVNKQALRGGLFTQTPNMNRAVSFEYMNQQLVWNEFSEMLLLLLPPLNSSSVRRLLLPFAKDKQSASSTGDTACPICHKSPTIPFNAQPCQHRYCYYCLGTHCAAHASFRCVRCNKHRSRASVDIKPQ